MTLSESNFDAREAPIDVTPEGGNGILPPRSSDLNGIDHAGLYTPYPLRVQANGNDIEETMDPRLLSISASGQAVPVVRPGPGGNASPAGSNVQTSLQGGETPKEEGETADQENFLEEDCFEESEKSDLDQPMISSKPLRTVRNPKGMIPVLKNRSFSSKPIEPRRWAKTSPRRILP